MGSTVKSIVGGAGKMLGIGSGNTPEFDPNRYGHNVRKEAFAATNEQQGKDLAAIQADARQRLQGIDERDARNRQTSLAAALEASANGVGPSLAQNQLREATDRNLAQQLSLASSARGNVNPALLQRQLMQNQAQTNQQAASQSADLRLQEQQLARAQLGQALDSMRGQDQNSYAQLNQAQSSAIAGQQGINDANRQAQMNLESLRSGNANAVQAAYAADVNSRRDNQTQIIGGLIQGASSAAAKPAASDEKFKKDVSDASSDVNEFLDALSAKKYSYKNPAKHGEGERVGVMAQDVEKGGPIGKAMVSEKSDGKYLDMAKGFGAILAAQAELNERMKALESKKKKKA